MPVWLFVTVLLNLPFHPVLEDLDTAHREGRISLLEKIEVMENAVKSPHMVTEPWRSRLQEYPAHPDWMTSWLVTAWQLRQRNNLLPVANYPMELPYHLDSEIVPVRVYYPNTNLAPLARATLAAAEYSWITIIDDFGYYEPPLTTPEGRYRIYIGDTGFGAGGYCAPISTYEATPWDDCVSYVVVDQRSPRWYVDSLVAHELNHATQAAMDCMEPVSWWENTATYMKFAVYPDSISYVRYYLESFQSLPYWSIAGGDQSSMYWYGGFLWAYFLAEQYGGPGREGAVFTREIWEHSMQETGNTNNSPHYMEALEGLLVDRGLGNLVEAIQDFSRARWFVGQNAVSAYEIFPGARNLTPPPPLTDTLTIDLPQTLTPIKTVWPRPWGVNYFRLRAPSTYRRNTTVEVTGEGRWALQVVSLSGESRTLKSDVGEGGALLTLDPEDEMLLIVLHVASDKFVPGLNPREGTSYELQVRSTVPLPKVSAVSPSSIRQGSSAVIQVYGAHFQEGASASFVPGNMLEVRDVLHDSDGQLKIQVSVDSSALLGDYKLVVVNPDGGTTGFDRAVYVIEGEKKTRDGGCSTGTHPAGPSILFLFFLLAFFRRLIRFS